MVVMVVLLVVVVMLVVVQNRPDTAQLTFIFSQGVVCPLRTWKMVIGAVFGGLEG